MDIKEAALSYLNIKGGYYIMKELRIFDKEKGFDYILSLSELIKAIEEFDRNILNGLWVIKKGAYGYGEIICAIEDKLKSNEQIIVESSMIFPLLKSNEEYFYHVCMKKQNYDLEIGVFDSTYLFIRNNCTELLNYIKNKYKEVQFLIASN